MAKKSLLARTEKRIRLVKKFAKKRTELKEKGDYASLDNLPKNASVSRLERRCFRCGRPRGFMRKFALCRICFRELANEGMIPGIRKSSW